MTATNAEQDWTVTDIDADEAPRPDDVVVMDAVDIYYSPVQALFAVDLRVGAGETVAVLGGNASPSDSRHQRGGGHRSARGLRAAEGLEAPAPEEALRAGRRGRAGAQRQCLAPETAQRETAAARAVGPDLDECLASRDRQQRLRRLVE